MPRKPNAAVQEWLGTAFKSVIACLLSLGVYVFNTNFSSLNGSLKELSVAIRAVEAHQIESDRRLAVIEVSREINSASYKKMIEDVQDIKAQLILITARSQTMADFVSNNFSKKK